MSTSEQTPLPPSIMQMAFGDGTPKKAVLTALVVGTILTTINHGDTILIGLMPPVWKVLLTYCVPYCVTTWGATTGKRAQWHRDHPPRSLTVEYNEPCLSGYHPHPLYVVCTHFPE